VSRASLVFVTIVLLSQLSVSTAQSKRDGKGDAPPASCRQIVLTDKKEDPCVTQNNQVEINSCAANEFARADCELNTLYQQLATRLAEPENKNRLRNAQRAWITFRDSACAYEADNNLGGSMYPALLQSCKTYHTMQRIDDLKKYLACTQNGCPE